MKNRNRRKRKPIRNAVNPLRFDPTRTITLRRLFAAEIKKRFRRLRYKVYFAIVDENLFGLSPTANAFCPTGAGGGLDNSCSPGGKEAAEKSIKDAPNEKFSGDPDNKYGTYIKVPFEVDETKSGAALADKLRDVKPVEASVPVSSLIATQPLLQREALQWMLKKGIEQVDRGEGPAVVRAGGKHYLADGNHRSSVAKFEGRETLKVRLYDLDKAGVTVNAEEEDGQWITISGTHVFVKGGEIIHGPKALKEVSKGENGPGSSLASAKAYGEKVADAVQAAKGETAKGWFGAERCIIATKAIVDTVPGAEAWGGYVQDGGGGGIYHVVAKVGDNYIDPTSGQFSRGKALAFTKDTFPEGYNAFKKIDLGEMRGRAGVVSKIKEKMTANAFTANAPDWRAMRDPEKVKQFQVWLQQQIDGEVLKDADRLFEKYAQLGFKKGAGRAFDDVKAKRWGKGEGDFYKGSRDQFLKDTFAHPVAVDKIKLLAGRSYDDLEGVTEQMSTRMSRSLTDGLVQGKSPRDIADDLVDDVDGIGEDRALTIARTEIIRAHADGQLEALGNLGVEEVGVAIEWSTTGDEKVCPKCRPMEGVILTLAEAAGLIPRHPNCRCAWIPVVEAEDGKKDTKALIDAAIDQSLEESGDKDPWPGADVDVDEKRPKSILDNEFTDFLMNAFCPTGEGGGLDNSCSGKTTSYNNIPHNERMVIAGDIADWTNGDVLDVMRRLKKDDTLMPIVKFAVADLAEQVASTHSPDEAKVKDFANKLKNDPEFEMDPVFVRGSRFVDGGHRVAAYHRAGRDTIPAIDVEPLYQKFAYPQARNAFCPTGPGGGQDNSCSPTGGGAGKGGGFQLPDEVKKNLESGLSGPLAMIREKVLIGAGATAEGIKEMDAHFDGHRWGGEDQARADKAIAEAYNTDTPLGQALRAQVEVETAILDHYESIRDSQTAQAETKSKADMKEAWEMGGGPKNDDAYESWEEQWKTEEAYRFRNAREPMKFYRKGGADKDVLPTSLNERGAKSVSLTGGAQPHFEPDHSWTSSQMKEAGYKVLGGFGYGRMGYDGEAEITWIKTAPTGNVFCPTGPGGGVDATCSPGEGGVGASKGGGKTKTYEPVVHDNPITKDWAEAADTYAKSTAAAAEAAKYKQAMEANSKNLDQVRNRVTAVKARVELARQNWAKQMGKMEPLDSRYQELTNDLDQMRPGEDDKEIARLTKERSEVLKELDKQAEKTDEALAKFRGQQAMATMKAHSEIRKDIKERAEKDGREILDKVEIPVRGEIDPGLRSQKEQAEKFLSGMTSHYHSQQLRHTALNMIDPTRQDQRACYNFPTASCDLSMRDDAGTIIHEYGHAMEDRLKLGELSRGFLASRVGEEPAKSFEQFGMAHKPHEVGRDDEFGKAFSPSSARYVGKFYKAGHTEILSMGVEQLYRDPVGFASKDPEYFKFTIGMLDGSLFQ